MLALTPSHRGGIRNSNRSGFFLSAYFPERVAGWVCYRRDECGCADQNPVLVILRLCAKLGSRTAHDGLCKWRDDVHCDTLAECVALTKVTVRGALLEAGLRGLVSWKTLARTWPLFPPAEPVAGEVVYHSECKATTPLRSLRNPENYCWMNAALHAVLAPRTVRDAVRLAASASAREWDWWRFHKRGRGGGQRRAGEPNFDALISVTLRELMGDWRSLPCYASAIAEVFYQGDQEDAHEFLMELLDPDRATTVAAPFCFVNAEIIHCGKPRCEGRVEVEDARPRTCVEAPVLTSEGARITTAQQALDEAYRTSIIYADYMWDCPQACGHATAEKRVQMTRAPGALWVQLKRWS